MITSMESGGTSLRFKKMKLKFMLIGLALALMLCISPVAAVSGDDFKEVISKVDGVDTYKYLNLNDPDEKYTKIECTRTYILKSFVTFRPHNIPDAPKMLVHTNKGSRIIYLPKSVDEWEIEYYSRFWYEPNLAKEYLKCSGVVNLNSYFGKYIEKGLELILSSSQSIASVQRTTLYWAIPSV